MSTHLSTPSFRLYPAYCFQISPTYNAWVKLSVADVHALRSELEFQGQHTYFHLNHPIRFVRVVGVIVAIDDVNTKYTVLTIDDGSGASIELKIVRIPHAKCNSTDSPSNTTIANVNVTSALGVFEVTINNQCLDIGTVVKAKGTISEFRGVKQLDLKRVWVVATTNEEAEAWTQSAAFKQEVLSRPWHVSAKEGRKIKSKMKADQKKMRDYERRRAEHEMKKMEHHNARVLHMARREAKLESRRQREEVLMNAGALA